MTELKLQPITGPGEYKQRNGLRAEIFKIIGGRAYGIATGIDMEGGLGEFIFPEEWDITGSCSYQPDALDLVQPKPEIEINRELLDAIYNALRGREILMTPGVAEDVARVAIAWDRAKRPKREPTASDIRDCYHKCYGGRLESYSDGFRDAILHAFELAQEPK